MKALISPNEDNRICQIERDENVFPVADPLYWKICPNDCTTNWTYSGGEFFRPVIVQEPVVEQIDPVEKLKAFLAANPDVAAIL